ncbi:MAG: hypothetical protein HYU77_02840 [Betaproteobacteria bacterium]|nr:hypothetical protein [Betaproteobacteria bacterium]
MKKQLFRRRSPHERATLPGRVSLYRIALRCRAAPGLGCGSRAKPVPLELERNPAVAEAWLNRSGTLLAVVGEITYPRSAFLQSLLDRHGLNGKALREVWVRDIMTPAASWEVLDYGTARRAATGIGGESRSLARPASAVSGKSPRAGRLTVATVTRVVR